MVDEQGHGTYDYPIEEVRLTVPPTDDTSLQVLTFRTWILGLSTCCILAIMQPLFAYRQQIVYLSSTCIEMFLLVAGKAMAARLPHKLVRLPGTKWTFSLNPGPFNIKEHVLISVLGNSGSYSPFAILIVTLVKVFYKTNITPLPAVLLILSTQLIGYGFAGIFMKFLVHSPYMWWPENLVSVSFYRALHTVEKRRKGHLTTFQFFIIITILSSAYSMVPGYFFPSISSLSLVCWIWKNSVTAQQIGSGLNGLGVGSFGLDWMTISAFLGSPLALPFDVIMNMMAGFILYFYILIPISYWTNSFKAKTFPIVSRDLFDDKGQIYNVSRIMGKKFEFNEDAYNSYSKLYFSAQFPYFYGFLFASLTSTFSQVVLFHGRSIWNQFRKAYKVQDEDIHTRLMKQNYDPIPQWWFYSILFSMIGLAIIACEGFNKQFQLPYWGILLANFVAFATLLPAGVLQATASIGLDISTILKFLIAYIQPGRPIGNLTFKIYGYSSINAALNFTSDFKLGHYMKIPPKQMFLVQVLGTILGSTINFAVTWWILDSVENICHPDLLPRGSPWTCPFERAAYSSVTAWGVVGPQRLFYPHGIYSKFLMFFIIGSIAPLLVWILSQVFPDKKWIRLVNFPMIFGAASLAPPATAVNFWSWFVIGAVFNYVVFKKYKGWWAKYNYVLSAGLDAGCALMVVLASATLTLEGIFGISWWGMDMNDHCPLAKCPTAPGIVVHGCPIYL